MGSLLNQGEQRARVAVLAEGLRSPAVAGDAAWRQAWGRGALGRVSPKCGQERVCQREVGRRKVQEAPGPNGFKTRTRNG